MLTQSELRERVHYNPETGIFTWRKTVNARSPAGSVAGTRTAPRQTISIAGRRYFAHHLAWLYVHGHLPTEIDHKNRRPLDNRIENLREASRSENNFNRGAATQLPPGVNWYKQTNRWRARIKVNGVEKTLGYYLDLDDAIRARRWAEDAFFPDFKRHAC